MPWIDEYIALDKCEHGKVYLLRCRNLALGAFNAQARKPEFIGIRTKFDRMYLDSEEHWDCGPPHGTACPTKDLGPLPEGIPAAEILNTICKKTQRPVEWVEGARWYVYTDTREPMPTYPESHGVAQTNQALYDFLWNLEVTLGLREP